MTGQISDVLLEIQKKVDNNQRLIDVINSHEYLSSTSLGKVASEKTWAFDSPSGSSGIFYFGGYYFFQSGNNDFSPSITFGTSNRAYGAHFMIVTGSATVDELTIRVTGTSINDEATRVTSDTQDIVIPNGTPADTFYETSKKWIGQVTIEVISGTPVQCNYGLNKYWDNNNLDFTVVGCDVTWLGGANDTSVDIEILHHKSTGWTYNAGAEPTPPAAIASMEDDYVTENNISNNQNSAWKRTNLDVDIAGSGSEGTIIRITTAANKTFELGNFILRIEADATVANIGGGSSGVESGATLPTSPDDWDFFVHIPTGRNVFMQYDGTDWQPIISYGTFTVYVDGTNGTDSLDKGFGSGTDAFKTIQFAIDSIPGLVGGDVTINISDDTYAEDIVINGKNFTTDATITLSGTLTLEESVTSATVAAGSGATQGTVTKVGQFAGDSYANLLCYFVTDAEYRVIDSHTDDVLTLVGNAPSSTAQDVEIYSWGTEISGSAGFTYQLGAGQSGIVNEFLKVSGSSRPVYVVNAHGEIEFNKCFIETTGTSALQIESLSVLRMDKCYISADTARGLTVSRQSSAKFTKVKVEGDGTNFGINATTSALATISEGSIIDGFATGARVTTATLNTSSLNSQTDNRIRNNTTGIEAFSGGLVTNTSDVQYSGNATDENPSGASDPAYID